MKKAGYEHDSDSLLTLTFIVYRAKKCMLKTCYPPHINTLAHCEGEKRSESSRMKLFGNCAITLCISKWASGRTDTPTCCHYSKVL